MTVCSSISDLLVVLAPEIQYSDVFVNKSHPYPILAPILGARDRCINAPGKFQPRFVMGWTQDGDLDPEPCPDGLMMST